MLCVMQRYYYYIEKGIASSEVSTLLKTDVEKIYALIPQPLLQAAGLQASVKRLLQEARDDFEFSMKKSIGEEPCVHFQWGLVKRAIRGYFLYSEQGKLKTVVCC